MVSKLRFFAILFSFLLVSETAFSHFKTSRIGGSKGLVVTPVADQIVSLTELLNDPDAVLTNEILQTSFLMSVPLATTPLTSTS